jgi:rsbT co-antagonist protein RsbR
MEVAGHLIRAARAAELLGAKAIFVGIRPAIAQALVHLGADLGGLKTLANLQAGIEHALHLQGLAIRPRAPLPERTR